MIDIYRCTIMIWHTHLWHLYPGWLHPICGDGDFTAHLHPSFDGLYNQCKDSGGQSTCLFDQPDSWHPANHQCTRLSSTSRCCYQRGETINFFLIQIIKSWFCCVMSVVLYTAYCCGHMLFIWIMYVPNRWKMERRCIQIILKTVVSCLCFCTNICAQ